jgi:hypothetical protein
MIYFIIGAYTTYKTIKNTIEIINNITYAVNIIRASKLARKYL